MSSTQRFGFFFPPLFGFNTNSSSSMYFLKFNIFIFGSDQMQLHHQQRAFDSKLQGRIGVIGDWIYRGEAMISDVDSLAHSLTGSDPGQIYKQASQKLQEHRVSILSHIFVLNIILIYISLSLKV